MAICVQQEPMAYFKIAGVFIEQQCDVSLFLLMSKERIADYHQPDDQAERPNFLE